MNLNALLKTLTVLLPIGQKIYNKIVRAKDAHEVDKILDTDDLDDLNRLIVGRVRRD